MKNHQNFPRTYAKAKRIIAFLLTAIMLTSTPLQAASLSDEQAVTYSDNISAAFQSEASIAEENSDTTVEIDSSSDSIDQPTETTDQAETTDPDAPAAPSDAIDDIAPSDTSAPDAESAPDNAEEAPAEIDIPQEDSASDAFSQPDSAESETSDTSDTSETDPDQIVIEDSPVAFQELPNEDQLASSIDANAVSLTRNIVGQVFANMVNNAATDQVYVGDNTYQEKSLKDYPLDMHDLSYYGDSPRVRYLDDENGNYLVYRDSYLILSQAEAESYTITYSQDESYAYVTPAIDLTEILTGDGIVFLKDNVGEDDILVFDGEPTIEGDYLIVPLAATEDITVNQLFSDGQLLADSSDEEPLPVYSSQVSDLSDEELTPENEPVSSQAIGVSWDANPSGTNWQGEITDFNFRDAKTDYTIDVFKFIFEFEIDFGIDFGFKFTTSGSSDGRETVKIAKISIPIKYVFAIDLEYNLEVEFDQTPIEVEGAFGAEFDFTLGVPSVVNLDYRTPVTIKNFKVLDENAYNKDIRFYVGSGISLSGNVLEISLDLGILDITIGPILRLEQYLQGGCYITARHDKDTYTEVDKTKDEIHTCTKEGLAGCQSFLIEELNRVSYDLQINLYFKKWQFDFIDSGWNQIRSDRYYKSLTHNTGVNHGICPHRFFKVPVNVSFSGSVPAPGMAVNVSDTLYVTEEEKHLQ